MEKDNEPEVEEVTLNIPKSIMDFLRDMAKTKSLWNCTPIQYCERAIMEMVDANLAAGEFNKPKTLAANYGLLSVFEAYNINYDKSAY